MGVLMMMTAAAVVAPDKRTDGETDCMWTVAATRNPDILQRFMAQGQRGAPLRCKDLESNETDPRSRNSREARSPGFPSCVPVLGWVGCSVCRSVGRPHSLPRCAVNGRAAAVENDGTSVSE